MSITLVWDRVVTFETDTAPLGEFNSGDTFNTFDGVLVPEDSFNNLDLWLMPKGATDYGQAIAASISSEMNVEHIFAEIPTTGEYEIWVEQFSAHLGQQQYAVAWWAGPTESPMMQGDYDGNGSVGTEDYDLWVMDFGSTSNLDADGNGNGIIDAADYTVWRDNLGAGTGSGLVNVPEPSVLMLLTIAGAVLPLSRKRRWPTCWDA